MEEKEMFLLGLLMVISYFDVRERRIPLVCIAAGIFYETVRILINVLQNADFLSDEFVWDIITATLLMGICFLITWMWKDSIGYGDILLIGVSTLLAGRVRLIESLVVTFSIFMVYSVGMIMRGCSKKMTVPFAPFLLMGYVAVCLFNVFGS
jgi:prepilin signal peptidase PulO-like enzyme (type II secretory pathway)